jgi:hypothetical protein
MIRAIRETKAMRRYVFSIVAAVAAAFSAHAAADNTLLIRLEPDGRYTVWHSKGETALAEGEVLALEASATPQGGEPMQTSAGLASAAVTKEGTVISLPDAKRDKTLLIDRDACGGVKVWHSEGTTSLTDAQITDLVVSALPGGGKSIALGTSLAKAYSTNYGVMVVIWTRAERRPLNLK